MNVAENYRHVMETIADTAYSCGRNPADIQLIVVSKGCSWEKIRPVYQEGARHFGESWMQEALPKVSHGPEDMHWHFIGHLQKNKVRKAVLGFEWIHSVDSYELARKISEVCVEEGIIGKVLLEVNTSGEETKQGFSPEEVRAYFEKVYALPSLEVQGLMTMAPFVPEESLIRSCFARLWHLRDEIVMRSEGAIVLPHLSMGMSHDYRLAIQEGATLLRIGTAIFK